MRGGTWAAVNWLLKIIFDLPDKVDLGGGGRDKR